jgi:hypothetical protein
MRARLVPLWWRRLRRTIPTSPLWHKTLRAGARLAVVSTAAVALASAGVATAGLSSACTTEANPEYLEGGKALGYCSGFTAVPLAEGECPGCKGQAFALCNGTSFNECVCGEIPSDYSFDSGTFEAESPVIVEGGLTSFEDGSALPCPVCEDKSAEEIPAAACPSHCAGVVAYALCVGNAYTQCACDMPEGYSLPTYTCDGG